MKALELKVMQEENQAKIDAWNEEERLRKEIPLPEVKVSSFIKMEKLK